MTPRKIAALAVAGVMLLVTTLIVWDVLVVTDEERLETFADAVTEEITRENIDLALTYVDPTAQPVIIEFRHETLRFDKSSESFETMARARLRPYEGTDQHALRKSVEIDGNKGHVSTETFSRRGKVGVEWELRKHGDRWLVSRMSIRR